MGIQEVIEPVITEPASPIVSAGKKRSKSRNLHRLPKSVFHDCPGLIYTSMYGWRYWITGTGQYVFKIGYQLGTLSTRNRRKRLKDSVHNTSSTFHHFVRMRFRQWNSPATFQRPMDLILSSSYKRPDVVPFHDIAVFSRGLEKHIPNGT